ncbi:BCCT family transporter [Chryseomicrobium palamuruense]|uniref:BCCT family transporter n=1 Tax=Chryseomicrobium palamuruense TaxID=682973 RepID=A0ABV8UXP1_9BACL
MKNATGVFYISVAVLIGLVLLGVFIPERLEEMTGKGQGFMTDSFGWYYLSIVTLFLVTCIYLLFSPVGRIKLGKVTDKPEFTRPTWIAMLFSAGLGIGLLFYGVHEPLSHYIISSPTGQEGTDQGVKDAMRYTFFHYGLSAWAIYGIIGMILAYFTFRKGELSLVSKTLRPLIGKHADGTTGKVIDIISVIATVMGVATSLGFGAMQINGGLTYLFDIPSNILVQGIIILVITILFLISATTGISKGIKILSNLNMGMACVLFLFVFIFGPTLFILNLFVDTIGLYLQNIVQMSLRISPLNEDTRSWINGWTIFYWAWWIAWSPFVGVFIARISRGRSIREFVVAVLFIPSLIGFLWFTTFGSAGIMTEMAGNISISALAPETALFGVLGELPLPLITSLFTIALIATFFITSADSGTFVLGMLTSNGSQNPTAQIKLVWGVMMSAIAIVLIYSGGLQGLQNTMILAAFPFSIILLMMLLSFIKALRKEAKELGIGKLPVVKKKLPKS